jgi:proteasome lid subunit RPN8/RPN11
MLTLSKTALEIMHQEASGSYPHECCGLLIGRMEADGRVAVEAFPTPNEWTNDVVLSDDESVHSLRDRFYISPQAYLKAQRKALGQGLDIVGCYHTHPDDRAWPSERDRVGASGVGGGPYFSFVVLSVMRGTPGEIGSALLSADGLQWLPEPLHIEE